jgi:uncharacterized OsmC-like protein
MVGNKSWRIQAVSEEGTALAFFRHGEALFVGGVQGAAISPVEHLLIAAAGCLALSCRAVLADGPKSSVEITAIGSKAADLPSRLARIDLTVHFGADIDPSEARSIVEKAEKLCTVTNTLLGSVAIEVAASSGRRVGSGGEPAER